VLTTSINNFASSFSSNHVKQRRFEVNSYFGRAYNLVSEYAQSQVVDVFDFVLLDVDAVHVHQNITDHDHRCLVIFPLARQAREKVVIQRFKNILKIRKRKVFWYLLFGLFLLNDR